MAEIASVLATSTFQNPTRQSDVSLKAAAMELETSFLTEMLKAAGAGDARKSFGGGIGEDQFTSFLLGAQAEKNRRGWWNWLGGNIVPRPGRKDPK